MEPYVDEFVHVHAIWARVLARPGHKLQVRLDVLARQVTVDAIRVLQSCDVESLRVFLAASFVIVTDNILPHIFVILYNQGLILMSPQGHKYYYYYCQKKRWKERKKERRSLGQALTVAFCQYEQIIHRGQIIIIIILLHALKQLHCNNVTMQKRNTSPNSSIMHARMAMRAPILRPMGKT